VRRTFVVLVVSHYLRDIPCKIFITTILFEFVKVMTKVLSVPFSWTWKKHRGNKKGKKGIFNDVTSHHHYVVSCNYTVFQKNQTPWCLIITLANVDQFSKFFYQVIRKKILYVHITKISTSPAICCYTTLWKSKNSKMLLTLTAPQQTVDMFLWTRWGLDLTFNI